MHPISIYLLNNQKLNYFIHPKLFGKEKEVTKHLYSSINLFLSTNKIKKLHKKATEYLYSKAKEKSYLNVIISVSFENKGKLVPPIVSKISYEIIEKNDINKKECFFIDSKSDDDFIKNKSICGYFI